GEPDPRGASVALAPARLVDAEIRDRVDDEVRDREHPPPPEQGHDRLGPGEGVGEPRRERGEELVWTRDRVPAVEPVHTAEVDAGAAEQEDRRQHEPANGGSVPPFEHALDEEDGPETEDEARSRE